MPVPRMHPGIATVHQAGTPSLAVIVLLLAVGCGGTPHERPVRVSPPPAPQAVDAPPRKAHAPAASSPAPSAPAPSSPASKAKWKCKASLVVEKCTPDPAKECAFKQWSAAGKVWTGGSGVRGSEALARKAALEDCRVNVILDKKDGPWPSTEDCTITTCSALP